ncbi:hypothetical protein EYF80_066022 [Liparis tanakae]|uniref:Uncharacterized protein n=1 Tax=Liparis tanakae TaxID=230148 RepID=A0A4Z2E4L5_9TELE|nr:hypothetical protein EYF80_066022 [Liparis tanakae]
MESLMDSTMPPTAPAALAASARVAPRSSTASFIICTDSSRASCMTAICCWLLTILDAVPMAAMMSGSNWDASQPAAAATGSIRLLISWTEAAIC